jgi:predicted nucleic acid-binding protein
MIVLDTNVVSELMRARPEQRVRAWLDAQASDDLFLTAISVAEILCGVERLPDGKRKEQMREATEAMFKEDFQERLLAFDEYSAEYHAKIVTHRQSIGRPISMADAQIAAICIQYQATLATRNLKDFEALGLELINPWLLEDSKLG